MLFEHIATALLCLGTAQQVSAVPAGRVFAFADGFLATAGSSSSSRSSSSSSSSASSSSSTTRSSSTQTLPTTSSSSSLAPTANNAGILGLPIGRAFATATPKTTTSSSSSTRTTSSSSSVRTTSSTTTSSSSSRLTTSSSSSTSTTRSSSSTTTSSSSSTRATSSSTLAAITLPAINLPSSSSTRTSSSSSIVTSSKVSSSSSSVAPSSSSSSSSVASVRPSSSSARASSSAVSSSASQSVFSISASSSVRPSSTRASSSAAPSASAAVASTSTSFIDIGCWADNTGVRAFSGPSYVDTVNMTRESCASFCSGQGYGYSGTEYSQECFCSLTAPVAQAWWCNMPCSGNANETCGSGGAMSVLYQANVTSTKPIATTDMGCFGDLATDRVFTGPSYSSLTSMTIENCGNFCLSQGYAYSGTEYGSQCYCSKVAPWSGKVGCAMACSGNPSEICGDGNALHVVKMDNGSTPAATTAAQSSNTTLAPVDLHQKFSNWNTWKSRGVNLGHWLILERWMDQSWFDSNAPGAQDEWTFCSALGKTACTTVLQQHWATWITESDIAAMAGINVNTLRIPIGFWAFIDPDATEPYVRSTQLQEVSRILGYASKYGMTVVLDLHGLPGSQNGKDHSGHIGSVNWLSDYNQVRLLQTFQAAASWVATNGQGVITGLEIANEPALSGWSDWVAYKDVVLQGYKIVQQYAPGVTTIFHDGFMDWAPWNHYFSKSDNVVLDTHNYWAFSPTDTEKALADVCNYISMFSNMNMPVWVGEFSLSIQTADLSAQEASWTLAFFQSQMQSWIQSAGGAFWSVKVMTTDGSQQNNAWSALGLAQSGLFSQINFWNFTQSACNSM